MPIVERALRRLAADPEEVRNLVVDVLERLRSTWPETLERFDTGDARASFRTWLAVVARNHAIDALRSRHGRATLPRAVARMDEASQELFRLLHWERRSLEEAHAVLAAKEPGRTFGDTAAAAREILDALPRASRVALASPRVPERGRGGDGGGEDPSAMPEPTAPDDSDPEAQHARRAVQAAMAEILANLSGDERLLLRTYFLEGATARDVAQLTGASSPSRVYERVGALTERLRVSLVERGVELADLSAMMDFDWLGSLGPKE